MNYEVGDLVKYQMYRGSEDNSPYHLAVVVGYRQRYIIIQDIDLTLEGDSRWYARKNAISLVSKACTITDV